MDTVKLSDQRASDKFLQNLMNFLMINHVANAFSQAWLNKG